ncbi:MAG: hypothetical protein ACYC3F_16780 [Gemmatimonadaceae bacterium]
MSDTEILDALERRIRHGGGPIVLGAWWSGPGAPDGYFCSRNAGALEVDANEHPDLRAAIVDMLRSGEADR